MLKIIAAATIILVALIGGLVPLLLNRGTAWRTLHFGDYFSRGVFLGAGLIHLLPDALNDFQSIPLSTPYPLLFIICALSIFAIQIIEQGAGHIAPNHNNSNSWLSYLLAVILSIHSIIAGAALGIGNSMSHILIIFFAIIAHKWAAAFALCVNMQKSNVPRRVVFSIIGLFSLMTPLGILIGSGFNHFIDTHDTAMFIQGTFGAIAAGTFIYIATFKPIKVKDDPYQNHSPILSTLSFGVGIGLMALISAWV